METELNFKEYLPREDGTRIFVFHCPGCGWDHCYLVGGPPGASPRWAFNGSMDKPTFTPSLLMLGDRRCHLYLREGQIQFLADCWHPMAGKTVNMHTAQEESPIPSKDMPTIMAQQAFRPASAGRPAPPNLFSAVLYHATDGERLVKSKGEFDALVEAGWRDTPAAFGKTPAVAVTAAPQCSGPIVTMNKGRTYVCMKCGERMSSAAPDKVRMAHEKTETFDRTPDDYVDPDAVPPTPAPPQVGDGMAAWANGDRDRMIALDLLFCAPEYRDENWDRLISAIRGSTLVPTEEKIVEEAVAEEKAAVASTSESSIETKAPKGKKVTKA